MTNLHLEKQNIKESRVLIVDDTATNRMFLNAIFKDAGFINIEEAVDEEDAIQKILDFRPDIVNVLRNYNRVASVLKLSIFSLKDKSVFTPTEIL